MIWDNVVRIVIAAVNFFDELRLLHPTRVPFENVDYYHSDQADFFDFDGLFFCLHVELFIEKTPRTLRLGLQVIPTALLSLTHLSMGTSGCTHSRCPRDHL